MSLGNFLSGLFGGIDMININRDGDRALMLLHIALENDFKRYARAEGWLYAKFDGQTPDEYIAYEIWGNKTCDALEQRVAKKNPWFAFTTADEYP